jgi:hypothetical protein
MFAYRNPECGSRNPVCVDRNHECAGRKSMCVNRSFVCRPMEQQAKRSGPYSDLSTPYNPSLYNPLK